MTTDAPPHGGDEGSAKARAAFQRAMPLTRLLDYGMDHADATELHRRVEEGAEWDAAAERLARRQLARAHEAEQAGHRWTATEAYRFAGVNLIFAQMAFNFDGARKRSLYAELVRCFTNAARLDSELAVERLTVPYRASQVVFWQVVPSSTERPPTVVVLGGHSGWGCAYMPFAQALAKRGMATLLPEIPGQGETRLFNGLYLDKDVHEAISTLAQHAVRSSQFGDAVGVWGNSFGGLPAALAAARDSTFSACCVNGAMAHFRVPPFRMAAEQAAAAVGVPDADERVEQVFEALRFDAARERIDCPLLVLHGGADPLIEREDQQPFLEAAAQPTLREWEDGLHTIYNHSRERTAVVADWFAGALRAAG